MNAYKVEIVLTEDGTITLQNLPFQAGENVEVIIQGKKLVFEANSHPLKGSLISYDEPFEAEVFLDEWEALK